MKKLLLIVVVLLVGCGTSQDDKEVTTTQAAETTEIEEIEEETETEEVEEIEEETEVEEEMPTQGTFDTEEFWKHLAMWEIDEAKENGELLFVWTDAESLENDVIANTELSGEKLGISDEQAEEIQQTSAKDFANLLGYFIDDTEQYVDNEEYFNKLRETQEHLRAFEFDLAKQKINEAKSLRESQ